MMKIFFGVPCPSSIPRPGVMCEGFFFDGSHVHSQKLTNFGRDSASFYPSPRSGRALVADCGDGFWREEGCRVRVQLSGRMRNNAPWKNHET